MYVLGAWRWVLAGAGGLWPCARDDITRSADRARGRRRARARHIVYYLLVTSTAARIYIRDLLPCMAAARAVPRVARARMPASRSATAMGAEGDLVERLERLSKLKADGLLSDEEFSRAKEQIECPDERQR